ncbi:type II toxin-antitoxin system VapC family toxin [Mucilaginibacter sp. cycad4]|uniref:type II toxin-antitoxin system VapC family toxin n=1 Tax=Mucilaginibacter sp. cycad4 TaxID=3342096 RepID=UPI002AABC7CF|nr:type II toxin-antitoxin system VapC family toxin [Mucilaginibacter gossypii]WPU99493.1 type II toxin-antitoxin system VapC family toxin [Mucilaginibacter gossypii]
MGITYLWDSNTAIYFLQKQFPPITEKFIEELLTESLPTISAITEIELLCWKTTSDADLQLLADFINDVTIFELEKAVKLKTAEIRKANRIKLPDAIIAATALVHELTLVTRNVKDFDQIRGLKVINPWA